MTNKKEFILIRWCKSFWWWLGRNTLCHVGLHDNRHIFADDLEPNPIMCFRCGK